MGWGDAPNLAMGSPEMARCIDPVSKQCAADWHCSNMTTISRLLCVCRFDLNAHTPIGEGVADARSVAEVAAFQVIAVLPSYGLRRRSG